MGKYQEDPEKYGKSSGKQHKSGYVEPVMSFDRLGEYYSRHLEEEKEKEYLVDGAILTCTYCTGKEIVIRDELDSPAEEYKYWAKENTDVDRMLLPEDFDKDKIAGRLTVSENLTADNNGQCFATTADCVKEKNIPYFGNCAIKYLNKEEKERLHTLHSGENKGKTEREEGSCKYLMDLDEEWENDDIGESYITYGDDVKGKVPGITMKSRLFCRHGGFIYPVTSGQIVKNRKWALEVLRNYLSTGIFEEEQVEEALQLLAEESEYKLPKYNSTVYGKERDYNRYDTYILGWTEYYNELSDIEIDPAYVKAMCYRETKMGYGESNPTTNVNRDIMQALDVKNYNIYEYIGISVNQFEADTSEYGYQPAQWIWKINHLEDPIGPQGDTYNEEKKERCGGIIATLFNTEKDGTGESYYDGSKRKYYLVTENVTPYMSIGVGMDKLWEELENADGIYETAIENYNGNAGLKDDYVKEVMDRAQKKGDEIDVP